MQCARSFARYQAAHDQPEISCDHIARPFGVLVGIGKVKVRSLYFDGALVTLTEHDPWTVITTVMFLQDDCFRICICMKEGSVPYPGQPELAYEGEKFSSRDRFRPC